MYTKKTSLDIEKKPKENQWFISPSLIYKVTLNQTKMLLSCTSYICLCISVEIHTFRVLEAGILKSRFSAVEAGILLLCKSDCFNIEDVWNT